MDLSIRPALAFHIDPSFCSQEQMVRALSQSEIDALQDALFQNEHPFNLRRAFLFEDINICITIPETQENPLEH